MTRVRKRKSRVIPNDPIVKLEVVNDRPTRRKVSEAVVARSRAKPAAPNHAFTIPSFPKSALPPGVIKDKHPLAMDAQIIEVNAWASENLYTGAFNNGVGFLGYPYLAQLAQVPEYRKITETIAMHMTRKFITLQSVGAASEGAVDKSEKIKQINDDLENFKVRDVFRKAAEVDGYFGRAHLYVDLGEPVDPKELKFPIGNGRSDLSKLKVSPGSLKGFKIIEPVWTYPSSYNSNNPLAGDWYNPQTWFVMGKEVHSTRCIRMVGHEVADLLKPAYSFGGLSMSQMAKPYVDNWLRTRQSVADTVWSFSVSGVKTDMATSMQGDGQELFDRAELFNNLRNNRGMMLLNKDSEEFFQVNTPLGTLDKLQAQSQEHMASVSSIPLVFLLGITPSGLNASSEGEIRAFYDFIHAHQAKFFQEPLTRVIDFIQLNRFGVIDPEITFIFEPLWSMDEKALAEIDKTEAETDDLRINGGVISPLEARKRVANSPDTPYAGLDITELPVPPGSQDIDGDGEIEPGEQQEIGGQSLDPGKPEGGDKPPFGQDEAKFEESKHPRADNGQFGSGGGGASTSAANAKQASSIVNKPAGISGKYRQGIQALLKDPNLTAVMKTQLKHKLIESYKSKAIQLAKKGDPKASAVAAKATKLEKSLGVQSVPISSAPSGVWGGKSLEEHTAGPKHTVDKSHGTGKFIVKTPDGKVIGSNGEPGVNVVTKKFETEAEAKAYAEQLDKEAPDKEKQKAENEKKLQELKQKEKEKQQAEIDAIASTPEAKKQYEALAGIMGGNAKHMINMAEAKLKNAGLEGVITPTEAALIYAYSGSSYDSLNEQMREGVMSKEQWGFAKGLNKALDKLPKYEGITERGATLPLEVFKKYKPGYVIEERAFTSTGKGKKFGGAYTYTIDGHSGRDIQKLSGHPGEKEVLFKSGSRFEVVSVTGNHIKLKEVDYD